MPNATHTRGLSAAGCLIMLATASVASAAALEDLDASQVARALAGEWEGQMLVRSAEGQLSNAPASMSARLDREDKSLELYYEGFAFGRPVEGAMLFSFDPQDIEARLHDDASNLRATCEASEKSEPASDSFQLMSSADAAEQMRLEFSKMDSGGWSIAYHLRDAQGEWSEIVVLQMDKMARGERSAAADNFDHTALFAMLEQDSAVASVETDD